MGLAALDARLIPVDACHLRDAPAPKRLLQPPPSARASPDTATAKKPTTSPHRTIGSQLFQPTETPHRTDNFTQSLHRTRRRSGRTR
jgi:hypothetical protein